MGDSKSEEHPPKTLKPEDIVAMKKLGGSSISPDGKWAAFVRSVPILEKEKSEYRGHIWLASIADDRQLQNLKWSVLFSQKIREIGFSQRPSPDPNRR